MFYLKVFWESLLESKINGIVFILLISSIVYLLNNESSIQSFVARNFIQDEQKIHFRVSLPESIDPIRVIHKMREIPGVVGAYQQNGKEIQGKIQKNLKDNNIYIPSYILSENLQIIEIVLSSELSPRNHNLIKQYLIKYLDNGEVVSTDIIYPENDSLKTFLFNFLLKWIVKGLTGLLSIFFCFSYYHLISTLVQKSFVYQMFQRKENIAIKSFGLGLSFIMVFLYLNLFFLFNYNWLALIGSLAVLVLLYSAFSVIVNKDVKNQIH